MDCIIEPYGNKGGLFLGDCRAAQDNLYLQQHNIGAVLTIMMDFNKTYHHLSHKVIRIYDMLDQNISQHFDQGIQFIQSQMQQGKNILVHCYAGRSRSASMVIAYLMVFRSMSFKEAYNFILQKRSCICPNQSFVRQLQEYQKKLQFRPQQQDMYLRSF